MSHPAPALALFLLTVLQPVQALTLGEAVDAALRRQPGTGLAEARLLESRAIETQASSLFARDPEFTLQHYNDGVGSGDGAREWDAALELPLWLPGQRAGRRAVAQAAAAQAEGLARAQRWNAADRVRNRLWSVLITKARAEHAATAVAQARQLEVAVERRVQAGELPQSELLLAQRETLGREGDLLRATADQVTAHERWRYVTGLEDIPIDYLESAAVDGGIEDGHPALARYLSDFRRAVANRDRVRSERRANPILSLGGKRERNPGGEPWNDALALGLNFPFGLRTHKAPGLAAAEWELLEAETAWDGARRALEESLIAARSELEFSRQALDTVRQAHKLAAESVRLLERAFEIGEADLFRLLQIRKQAIDAAWDVRRLELQVGSNIASYNQALGVLPE